MSDPLSFDAVVAAARERTGLDDFGEDEWREGLHRLLAALHTDARLSPTGHGIAAAMLTDQLVARLYVTELAFEVPGDR